MRYLEKTSSKYLREKYELLVGWGAGREEFCKRYNPFMYPLDYMIDISNKLKGKIINGMKISSPDILMSMKEKRVCIVIFPNPEMDIEEEAKKYISDFDTIVSRLIYVEDSNWGHWYASEREDLIFEYLLKKLEITDPCYLDIGVCHPVIRNNTYKLYEEGYYNGVLVEPNLFMCELIEQYRPKNKVVKMGSSARTEHQYLRYYKHPNPSFMGHNTFDLTIAKEEGFESNFVEVPVVNINKIIDENCLEIPDLLDIDTEGLDFELLNNLDTEKFPIKIICVEMWKNISEFEDMMEKKGYALIMSTNSNNIYIRKNLLCNL